MLKLRMKRLILATLCTLSVIPVPAVYAEYKAHTDTGTTIFDYIENRRREQRDKALTAEQTQFLADIENARNNLPHEIVEGEPVPIAFEGEDLAYNPTTGEFIAKGKVDIIQLEGYRLQTNEATGNINEQEITIQGKARMMQLKDNAPRVTLDGYNTVYNYSTKAGTMESVTGKTGEYYISGKRFEFYPDHIVAYDAYQTKCGAKNPDYRISAKRMEIYPEQIIRMYDMKLWIGNMVVGTKKYDERSFDSTDSPYFPHVGYRSSHGVYVRDKFTFPVINEHFNVILNAYIETKNGIRSNVEFEHINREFAARTLYGYYYDGDGNWLKKEPSLDLYYSKDIKGLPLTYSLEYEVGHWDSGNTSSDHQEYNINLAHNPITLWNTYTLNLNTGYKITRDDIDGGGSNTVKGLNYGITLFREFDDNFAAFTAFEYSKANSRNSLYDFDTDSYSHKFLTGASYKLTDKDRFVVGLKFDSKKGKLADADYYWYRDLHCSTAIIRWRQKRSEWDIRWQFTPW